MLQKLLTGCDLDCLSCCTQWGIAVAPGQAGSLLCRVVLCAAVMQISEFCDLVAPGRHVKVRGGGFHIRLRFNLATSPEIS